MRKPLSACALLAALCLPAVSFAEPMRSAKEGPDRAGFTLELGLGLGHTAAVIDGSAGVSEVGIAPLSLSLGAFLSDDLALLARAAGTSYGWGGSQIGNYFYGVVGQHWFTDHWFGSAGAGFALFGSSSFSQGEAETESGIGLSLRGGYSFLTTRNHSLRFALELFPSFYDRADVVGTALNFEWQYL